MITKEQILHEHSEQELRASWKDASFGKMSIMTWSKETDKVTEYYPKDEDDLVEKYKEGMERYRKKQEAFRK